MLKIDAMFIFRQWFLYWHLPRGGRLLCALLSGTAGILKPLFFPGIILRNSLKLSDDKGHGRLSAANNDIILREGVCTDLLGPSLAPPPVEPFTSSQIFFKISGIFSFFGSVISLPGAGQIRGHPAARKSERRTARHLPGD